MLDSMIFIGNYVEIDARKMILRLDQADKDCAKYSLLNQVHSQESTSAMLSPRHLWRLGNPYREGNRPSTWTCYRQSSYLYNRRRVGVMDP